MNRLRPLSGFIQQNRPERILIRNIFDEKKSILRRIVGICKSISSDDSSEKEEIVEREGIVLSIPGLSKFANTNRRIIARRASSDSFY